MTRFANTRGFPVQLARLFQEAFRCNHGLLEIVTGAAVEREPDIARVQLHPKSRSAFGLRELDDKHFVIAETRKGNAPRPVLAFGDEKETRIGSNELPLGDFIGR